MNPLAPGPGPAREQPKKFECLTAAFGSPRLSPLLADGGRLVARLLWPKEPRCCRCPPPVVSLLTRTCTAPCISCPSTPRRRRLAVSQAPARLEVPVHAVDGAGVADGGGHVLHILLSHQHHRWFARRITNHEPYALPALALHLLACLPLVALHRAPAADRPPLAPGLYLLGTC